MFRYLSSSSRRAWLVPTGSRSRKMGQETLGRSKKLSIKYRPETCDVLIFLLSPVSITSRYAFHRTNLLSHLSARTRARLCLHLGSQTKTPVPLRQHTLPI